MIQVKFDETHFRSIVEDKNKYWTLGNNILYNLCEEHPSHNGYDEIIAKVWLIGRSYAVSIERIRKKVKGNKNMPSEDSESFFINVSKKLKEEFSRTSFDKELDELKKKTKFDFETLNAVLKIHSKLVSALTLITGDNKRSFASKYLHFHARIVPIYDSRASSAIIMLINGEKKKREVKKVKEEFKQRYDTVKFDSNYLDFCVRYLVVKNFIEENSSIKQATSRDIDTYLLTIADNNKK
jgi:hypothetical protein